MNWTEEHGNFYCRPYKVVWRHVGWEAWCFLPGSGCLESELRSIEAAKSLCEAHSQKAAA